MKPTLSRVTVDMIFIQGSTASFSINNTLSLHGDIELTDFDMIGGQVTLATNQDNFKMYPGTVFVGNTTIVGSLTFMEGSHSVTGELHVLGMLNASSGANVEFVGLSGPGSVTVTEEMVVEADATVTFNDGFEVCSQRYDIDGSMTLDGGTYTMNGSMYISSNGTFSASQTTIDFHDDVVVVGTAELLNGVHVISGTVSVNGSLRTTGTTTVDGVVAVGGSLSTAGTTKFISEISVDGSLSVAGDTSFGMSLQLMEGKHTLQGQLMVDGDAVFGNGVTLTHALTSVANSGSLSLTVGGMMVLDTGAKIDVDQKSSYRISSFGGISFAKYPSHGGEATTDLFDLNTNAVYGNFDDVTTMGQQRYGGADGSQYGNVGCWRT